MIDDWQALVDQLIEKTWAGDLAWKEVSFRHLTPKEHGAHAAFRTDFSGKSLSLYREFRFSKTEPCHTFFHLDVIDSSGKALEAAPFLESNRELFNSVAFKPWEIDAEMRKKLTEEGFLVRFEAKHWRSRTVLYQEPDFYLNVYLEGCSRQGKYFWGGTFQELRQWTSPAGREITPEKQREIMDRIVEWGKSIGECFQFERGISMEEMHADMVSKGYTVVKNSNGTWTWTLPARKAE